MLRLRERARWVTPVLLTATSLFFPTGCGAVKELASAPASMEDIGALEEDLDSPDPVTRERTAHRLYNAWERAVLLAHPQNDCIITRVRELLEGLARDDPDENVRRTAAESLRRMDEVRKRREDP